MLFNSITFIFLFLPVTLILFYGIARFDRRAAAGFLVIASLFFYGWWDSRYVLLLATSACGNFLLADVVFRARRAPNTAKTWLAVAIAGDLAVLFYYKYANFFIENLNALSGSEWSLRYVALPLGVSFFTFTQIAFLVDTWRGAVREKGFINYLLFVTYFPHLIAGPILHHSEMMPQFAGPAPYRFSPDRFAAGISLFIMGLAKKTICADLMSPIAHSVFTAAAQQPVDLPHAWYGALAFCLQIYFDFSAYSDMALGVSLMFGIRLPLNFNSPYKSHSIIEFWRRWHMTLSRFLRDYLYIPLGGSRSSPLRRYANLLITMLLGGLWHGAAWTYILWGALHGIYLVINHAWRGLTRGAFKSPLFNLAGMAVTFVAVTAAWTVFRATSLSAAASMLTGMMGLNGLHATASPYVSNFQLILFPPLLAICWFMPNAYQMLDRFSPALQQPSEDRSWLEWRPNIWWALGMGILAALSLSQIVSGPPPAFIYFQF